MAIAKLSSAEQTRHVQEFYEQAPAFAQPILQKLKRAIAAADPALTPAWKWGCPVYEKKEVGMVMGIGVFKQHVSISFFQGALLPDPQTMVSTSQDSKGMRSFKFTGAEQIPEQELTDYIRAAAQIKYGTAAKKPERDMIVIPEDLRALLTEKQLLPTFEKLAYTHRKEYVRWINEAKRPETRAARLTKTADRIAVGQTFS